jgi:ABC-2 type transport system permease protein
MRAVGNIFWRNMTNFVRDKVRLIASLVMSLFFLFVFSFVMKSSMGGVVAQPMSYLVTGVIIMTVFQQALNNSMDILNDMSSGFMKEILVAPISRWQISLGQILSSSAVAVVQGLIVLVISLFMGLTLDFVHFLEILGVMALAGVTFGAIGLFLATVARSSVRFQMIVTIIMMPLSFLSGALIPTTIMPSFLQPIVYLNPLTYITSAFRFVAMRMEQMPAAELVKVGVAYNVHGFTILPWMGLVVIAAMGLAFLALSVWKFSRADFSVVKTFHHHH